MNYSFNVMVHDYKAGTYAPLGSGHAAAYEVKYLDYPLNIPLAIK